MKVQKIMPTTYLLIAMLVLFAIHFLFPGKVIIPPLWNLLGIIPLGIGVAINLAADSAFHKTGTTVKPFQESSALLTSGAFRISRNPMYLGFVLILVGVAILLRSSTPYLVIIAFAIFIDRVFITVEESMLAQKFGSSWVEYKQKTRRWM